MLEITGDKEKATVSVVEMEENHGKVWSDIYNMFAQFTPLISQWPTAHESETGCE